MIFESFLNTIDLFGIPLTINFGGKEKSKSKLGGICSLIFIGLVVWVTFNSSKDLFSRKIPKTITSESYNESPKLMSISPSTFPLGFVVHTPDTLGYQAFVDESIYTLKVTHTQIERVKYENGTTETIYTLTDVALENCTAEHLGELYASVAYLDLASSYCIARNQSEITIQGVYESPIYQSLDIQVIECDNSTSRIPCAPREILDEFLAGAWFLAAYANMAVDPKNYSRPDSKFRDIYYTMISPSNYKYTEIELSHVEVQTDLGWLIQSIDQQDFIRTNKITEYLYFNPHPKKVLMFCTFKVSKLEQSYLRSYKKIQDVLAEVGGLANAFMMILMILTNHYLNLKVKESLMNELFDLNISQLLGDEKSITQKYKLQTNSVIEKNKRNDAFEKNAASYGAKAASATKIGQKKNFLISESGNKKVCLTSTDSVDHNDMQSRSTTNEKLRRKLKKLSVKDVTTNGNEKVNLRAETPAQKFEWQEDTIPKAIPKESFRNMMSFEGLLYAPESPKNDFIVQESEGDKKKFKALKPKFKVLEDLEDENPEDPSLIIDNFSNEGNQAPRDLEDNQIKRKITKESCQKETDFEQRIQNKCFDEIKISLEKDGCAQNNIIEKTQNEPNNSYSESSGLNITIWEYIISFFYQSKRLKSKWKLFKEGIVKTNERLDMLNLLKKLREVDKLKALLMDYDQLLIFNNLPNPEINLDKPGVQEIEKSFARAFLKKSTFIQKYGTKREVDDSFRSIKKKNEKKDIDKKLLELYHGSNF